MDARLRRLEELASSLSTHNNQPNTSTLENPQQQGPHSTQTDSRQSLILFADSRKEDQDVVDTANRLECAALEVPLHSMTQSNIDVSLFFYNRTSRVRD